MQSPFKLDQKTILVTGASSGIGKSVSEWIARTGGTVIATGRDNAKLNRLVASLEGIEHRFVKADLTNPKSMGRLVESIDRPLNGIVYSAGIFRPWPAKMIDEKQVEKLFPINFEAPILLTSQLLRARMVSRRASIVFITSIATDSVYKAGALYSSSKAALTSYAKVLAVEYAPKGIRSNCVAPGLVSSPMLGALQKSYIEEIELRYPLKLGTPEDVAYATLFLLSDAAKWITGTTITVDGGFSCT